MVERLAEEVFLLARVALDRLSLRDQPTDVVLGGSVLAARHAPLMEGVSRRLAASAPRANLLVVDEPRWSVLHFSGWTPSGRRQTPRVRYERRCSPVLVPIAPPPARLADHVGRITPSAMELSCDVLVVGGGCGGVAAALAASDMGRLVVLTEAGSRAGGQLTSQAVPPDEHPWVETTGITARYRQLREAVRTRYQQSRRLTEQARQDPLFNPGAAWVSNLSAEPEVFREVLEDMLHPVQAQGLLYSLMRHRPVRVDMTGDHIGSQLPKPADRRRADDYSRLHSRRDR